MSWRGWGTDKVAKRELLKLLLNKTPTSINHRIYISRVHTGQNHGIMPYGDMKYIYFSVAEAARKGSKTTAALLGALIITN